MRDLGHLTVVISAPSRSMSAYEDEDATDPVRAWRSDVRAVQNTYRNQAWGPVRMIHSPEVLLIEYVLACLLQPGASADWGYHLARQEAERYDARFRTGLIPESAPLVDDIAHFWCQHHVGKPWREWLGTPSLP